MRIDKFQAMQAAPIATGPSRNTGPTSQFESGRNADDNRSNERFSQAGAIMAGQDLSNISRNELKGLTDKLYNAGAITGEQRLDLTAPYVDNLNAQGQSIANPDQKRNFLSDLKASLEAARQLRPDDKASIAYLQKVNNIANSLAATSE